MATGLIIGLPLQGHMTPLVPLAAELASRRHDLVFYASAPFADAVTRTGARYRAYRAESVHALAELPERTDELSSMLMAIVGDVLEADLPEMSRLRPDYVVADSLAPWGQWIGQVLGVPVITSITTFAVNRHVLAFAAAHGVRPKSARLMWSKLRHVARAGLARRRLSRRYGVPGIGVLATVFGRSPCNLVHTSRELQPCADTFDGSFHFVGPPDAPAGPPAEASGVASRPQGAAWANGGSPLVYVSLGTLFNTDVRFYRQCFEALRDEPVRVVLSVGTRVVAADLGPAPANVTVAPFVPQLAVLERASAFVTHAGMNSAAESLRLGVPMVAVPQMGEQELVGRRLEQLGAAVYVAKGGVSADGLKTAVRRVLGDERFRIAARSLGDSLLAAGGTRRAANLVQAHLAGT